MLIKHGEEVDSAVKRSAAGVAFSHAGRRSFLPAELRIFADFSDFSKICIMQLTKLPNGSIITNKE